jgi:hypothetical protein
MNIGGLVSALLPVFFVLALGYFAGKRNAFDSHQAAGLSKLALSFALPASLFVSMTDIPKDLLLQQGRLVLALILSHAGVYISYSRIWPGGSRTHTGSYERRECGARGSGHQSDGTARSHPAGDGCGGEE